MSRCVGPVCSETSAPGNPVVNAISRHSAGIRAESPGGHAHRASATAPCGRRLLEIGAETQTHRARGRTRAGVWPQGADERGPAFVPEVVADESGFVLPHAKAERRVDQAIGAGGKAV